MACKEDSGWEGTYVNAGNCVKWMDLVTLRKKFNKVWDLLKKEEKQDGDKYGFEDETDERVKEQVEELATIQGFFSVRFNCQHYVDEVYYIITGGTFLDRLDKLTLDYSYGHLANGGTNYGPWIVWLKDQCHACTVFRVQDSEIPYSRSIVCSGQYISNVDPSHWRAQCIWSASGGCNYPAEELGDWQQYCEINGDWRNWNFLKQYIIDVAESLFPKEYCGEDGTPCTKETTWCCGLQAHAYYSEECGEWPDCPDNDTTKYYRRKIKWVSLGVNTIGGGLGGGSTIGGGALSGWVSQKISAIHLTNIWDRVNKMVGDKTLRKCFYNKCKYYQSNEKKERWLWKESVPMYATGSTADIMDRKESCENCEKAAVGESICACNFNDINAMLDEYISATCTCENEGEYKGEKLTNFGSVDSCNCCKGKCCCNCECTEDLTKEECMKKDCSKYGTKMGPTWLGYYEKGDSKNDEKYGDAVECGCNKIPPCDPPKPCCKKECCMGEWRVIETGHNLPYIGGRLCNCKLDAPSDCQWCPPYYNYEGFMEIQVKHCQKDWQTVDSWTTKEGKPCRNLNNCCKTS